MMTAEILANDDGSITVREVDLNGVPHAYRVAPQDAHAYLVQLGLGDVGLTLSDTDADRIELLAIMHEFKALFDDVLAEDRTDKLLELRARFLTLREAVRIAEADEVEGTS